MTDIDLIERLKRAIVEGDPNKAIELTKQSVNLSIESKEILEKAIVKGAEEAGNLYEQEEYFLADLLMTGDALNAATEIIVNSLEDKSTMQSKGKILIGTVEGDIHDIGKSLVISLLQGQGYEILDLGSDAPPEEFVRKAKEFNPNIIGISGLMTMSISKMQETVNLLKNENFPSRIIVGGGILSKASCEMIGADDYAKDGWEGVKKINKLLKNQEIGGE